MSDALSLLASLVLEDGQRWGDVAQPWQWADARALLVDLRRLNYWTRPRGASKTTDLAGAALAALVTQLPAGSRSYAAAADRDQGALLVDAANGFTSRTPGLGAAVNVETWRIANTRNGALLDVLAADAASAYGLRPHLLVVDEFAQWATTPGPRRFWSALFSAMPKVPGSRLVILTTAGDPAHPAGKLLERARASDRWYVDEVPGPCPWLQAGDLAEQRAELPEWEFARLHLNRWTSSADRLTTADDLAACVTLTNFPLPYDPSHRYVIGVDLATKGDRSVVAVCHAEDREVAGDGPPRRRVVLDRLGVWRGTRAAPLSLSVVEEWILEAAHAYGRPRVVFDPFQAVGMMQRLERKGVSVEEFTFTAASVGKLGLVLHQIIRNHDLAIPDDPELIDELANVRLREVSPGVVRLDHDAGQHDDRAVAIALAAQRLLRVATRGEAAPPIEILKMPGDCWTLSDDAFFGLSELSW